MSFWTKFGWPAWVPNWARVFPWTLMGGSIMSVIIGLAVNLAVYFTAVNRRVDEWRWLTAADPCSVMLAISSAASSIANLGYREGGGARFHVLKQDGRPFDECDQEYASTTGVMEAIKSIFRGKALRISISSTVFTLACFTNPQLWNHVLRLVDVSIPFDGKADIHFTPNILSDELFGSEFAFLHPVMRAWPSRRWMSHEISTSPVQCARAAQSSPLALGGSRSAKSGRVRPLTSPTR
ncbi:hypothetical protein QBC45DRAFT_245209 [Copromyces sp. CBS 386.78]|nr:hypothetical protein QBC45DRAFT_245209 [Copromyces sp. CBS 386.78]